MSYEVVRLGDVCKVTGGFAFKSTDYLEEGIPLIRIGNIGNEKIDIKENTVCVDEKFLNKCQNFIVNKGDILVALSGATTGKFGIYDLEEISLLNQRVGRIVPNLEKIDNKFILFNLYVLKDKILSSAGGAAQPNISPKEIESFEIPLPPLDIQKKIADTLDKAQELIDKRKEQISALDKFLENLFLDMFGDPVSNPMGWEVKEIGEILESKPTNGFFAKNDDQIDDGTGVIWISDMINRFYCNVSGLKKFKTKSSDIDKYKVSYGDALFCRSSLTQEGIGKASIIPESLDEEVLFECHIIKIRLNKQVLIPEFFKSFTNLEFFRNQMLKNANTSTMTTISQQSLVKGKIYVPNIELQLKFKQIVHKIFSEKTKLEASLKEMEDNFNSIMQRAFKGELF